MKVGVRVATSLSRFLTSRLELAVVATLFQLLSIVATCLTDCYIAEVLE